MTLTTIISNAAVDMLDHLSSLTVLVVFGSFMYLVILKPIYNVYYHPLRKYPGPRLWAAFNIPWFFMILRGQPHEETARMHRKYGPAVRLAPDELSFLWPEAWQDIMGHRKGQQTENVKAPHLAQEPNSIVESSTEVHGRMRRLLSHGFAASTMIEQQPIIKGYVDLLIERLREKSQNGSTPVDIVSWYNFTTFDIIGDLTFGQPFGCLRDSNLHPWIEMIFNSLKFSAIFMAVDRVFPGAKYLTPLLLSRKQMRDIHDHKQLTKAALSKRLQLPTYRPDFIQSMTNSKRLNGQLMTPEEVEVNAEVLVVAGSETTATALSGATYWLTKTPHVLKKLADEVRSSFKDESEINLLNAAQLRYLNAVLKETLRIYPPAAVAMPRITPPKGSIVHGHAIPGNTIIGIPHWAMYHSAENWVDADQFIPERWLGDDPRFADDRKDCFQPFSFGPRNCIGQNLAYAEMRLILSRILWNFDIKPAGDSKNWLDQDIYFLYDKSALSIYLRPVRLGS